MGYPLYTTFSFENISDTKEPLLLEKADQVFFVLRNICVFVNKRSKHFFKIVVVNPQLLAKDLQP